MSPNVRTSCWLGISLGAAVSMMAAPAQGSVSKAPVPRIKKSAEHRRAVRIPKRSKKPGVPTSVDPRPSGSATQCLPGYTICDFIHPRITMGAQYALAHLYVQGGEDCALALSMLGAADRGAIVGIHKEDEGKPALMAQRQGTAWWKLIPDGEGAIVAELEQPPMVVFEKRLATQRHALATEMKEAWLGSSLSGRWFQPPPAKKTGCAAPPTPRVTDEPPKVSEPPRCVCDPSIPATVFKQCGVASTGVARECLRVPGETCGICEGSSKKIRECLEKNDERHRAERQRCKDEHSPAKTAKYAIECTKAIAECAEGKLTACAEATRCVADPEPVREFRECLSKESARWDREVKRCQSLR